jgi:hypothetical protein
MDKVTPGAREGVFQVKRVRAVLLACSRRYPVPLSGRVGTGGSTLEYIGEARTAQLQDKKIGKMGQIPLPNVKSELLNCSG